MQPESLWVVLKNRYFRPCSDVVCLDLRTQMLHVDNQLRDNTVRTVYIIYDQLLCSLSRQPPQSYFRSTATDVMYYNNTILLL